MSGKKRKCYKCNVNTDIREKSIGDKCFECDNCKELLCEHCSTEELTASEIRVMQQKKARTLKLLCKSCLEGNASANETLVNVQKVVGEAFAKIEAEYRKYMDRIKEELNRIPEIEVAVRHIRDEVSDRNAKTNKELCIPTYAEKVKKFNHEALLIQPREGNKVNAIETKAKIIENINPVNLEVGITQLKKVSNGGVVISCETKQEINKLEKEVQSQMGKDFKIQRVEKKKPRIKLIGIEDGLSKEEVKAALLNQNSFLDRETAEIEVLLIKKMKSKCMAIIEVDKNTFAKTIAENKVKIGWSLCPVFEHINILRCFKCLGYGHKADICTNNVTCGKCGEHDHCAKNCSNTFIKCVNCAIANKKLGLSLNEEHTAVDFNCPVYIRQLEQRKKLIEYTL